MTTATTSSSPPVARDYQLEDAADNLLNALFGLYNGHGSAADVRQKSIDLRNLLKERQHADN
jgi:hypothetical protein